MNKLIFFALTLMLSIGLVACGNNDKHEEKPEESSTPSLKVEIGEEEDNKEVASSSADESSDESGTIDEPVESEEPTESELKEGSYEIVHTESDDNFPVLFVIVPNQNIDQLKLVAQELKSEYPSKDFIGFNAIFFTEDHQQEAINHDSSNAFSKLIVNYKGSVSKLIFFDDQKPIQIK